MTATRKRESILIGFPCDYCGEQIEDDERMVMVECGEAHQWRVHEGCFIYVEGACPECETETTPHDTGAMSE